MMKKTIASILACLMMLTLLVGCGSAKNEEPAAAGVDLATIQTMGDAYAMSTGANQAAWNDTEIIYAYEADGVYYRVRANLPEDVSAALDALDFADENHEEKMREILSPVPVTSAENLSEQIPSQEELDKLLGKTGQELLDDGWSNWGFNLDTMEFYMYHGDFSYIVVFDGALEMSDDLDGTEALKPLTVKSVTFEGLGDAANFD